MGENDLIRHVEPLDPKFCLFVLEFYGQVNYEMSSRSVNSGTVPRCWVASSTGASYYLAYGSAGACCACSRCETSGLSFYFHLVYPVFLFKRLISWETAGHTEILWSRPVYQNGYCHLHT